jgi:hypothetical protein
MHTHGDIGKDVESHVLLIASTARAVQVMANIATKLAIVTTRLQNGGEREPKRADKFARQGVGQPWT